MIIVRLDVNNCFFNIINQTSVPKKFFQHDLLNVFVYFK